MSGSDSWLARTEKLFKLNISNRLQSNPYRPSTFLHCTGVTTQKDIHDGDYFLFTELQLDTVNELLFEYDTPFDEQSIKKAITALNLVWNYYWNSKGQSKTLDFNSLYELGMAIQLLRSVDEKKESNFYNLFREIYDAIINRLISIPLLNQQEQAQKLSQELSEKKGRGSEVLALLSGEPFTGRELAVEEHLGSNQIMVDMGFTKTELLPPFSPLLKPASAPGPGSEGNRVSPDHKLNKRFRPGPA